MGVNDMKKHKKKKNKTNYTEFIHIPHVDEGWINSKINGHGGSFSYDGVNSIIKIGYIGSTGRFKVWYYNLILLLKYVIRKCKEVIKHVC